MNKVKVMDITKKLEEKFPKYLSEEWDNVGLLVGENNQRVKKIQLSLDINKKVINNAVEKGVDMIITHHPFIFKGVKTISNETRLGNNIIKLVKNNIAVYTLHTNLDSAKNGLNDYILKKLGIENSEVLDPISEGDKENGIGRIYELDKKEYISDYAKKLKRILEIDKVRVVMNRDKKVKRIGLVNGSGASYISDMRRANVDLFITGDVKYHEAFDSLEKKLPLIDIGHYESEVCFYELIKNEIPKEIEIEIFNDDPVFETV